jgi:hypothetical protein
VVRHKLQPVVTNFSQFIPKTEQFALQHLPFAKNLLSPLTLGLQKLHVCLNHFILYHKEHNNEVRYPMCNANWYKTNYDNVDDGFVGNRKKRGRKKKNTRGEGKEVVNERKILALVMQYRLVIDRLKRLFSSIKDANLMIWHAATNGHKKDGKLCHPVDAR